MLKETLEFGKLRPNHRKRKDLIFSCGTTQIRRFSNPEIQRYLGFNDPGIRRVKVKLGQKAQLLNG
jgi:hypothetical protein